MGLKDLIRENPVYVSLIRPARARLHRLLDARLDDETYFVRRHKKIFGYTPDFRHPETFNEKIIHRILFDRNPLYTHLADKLKSRIYIAYRLRDFASIGGGYSFLNETDDILSSTSPLYEKLDNLKPIIEQTNVCPYLPKLYGYWKSVSEIDFDKLPSSFALKTNHDSGSVFLVPDKDAFLSNKKLFKETMKKFKEHLSTNYYDLFREWHYKDIEPRIFAEELLGFETSKEYTAPLDYKVHCLGNKLFMQVDTDRFTNHSRVCFDENWNRLPFSLGFPLCEKEIEKPEKLSEMFSMAKTLSKGLGTLRVDLYQIEGRLFAGELTFTHGCGSEKFTPNEWDKKWGDFWQ